MPNQVRVPDDTSSIQNIGAFIMQYTPYQNAFLNALVNRIGRVLITSRTWEDPWATFNKGRLEYGETVEEIFVNIAKAESYDPALAESLVFKRTIPDVRAAYHTMNWQKVYPMTISNDQLRQAFLSYGALTDLIARIVDSMYTGMQKDTYLTKKYMLVKEALNGGIYTVTVQDVDTTPTDAVKKFRRYTNDLTFLKGTFNRAGVQTSTPISEQVIIVPNSVEATLGVDVLANAFNLSQVDYLGTRIAVDEFTFDEYDTNRLKGLLGIEEEDDLFTSEETTSLENMVAFKLDRQWMMVFDNFEQFTENYNGRGLYWQYFFHAWKTFSSSPFANAIAFTTQAGSVSQVTVSPSSSNCVVGTSMQLTAAVTATGLVDKTVTWSMSATTPVKSGTTLDPSTGVLHVAADELVGNTITVKATSVADSSKTGSSTITVVAAS